MNRRSFLELLAIGLLGLPRTMVRGASTADSPESAAKLAWELTTTGSVEAWVDAFEPAALDELRRTFLSLVEMSIQQGDAEEPLRFFEATSLVALCKLESRRFAIRLLRGARRANPHPCADAAGVTFVALGHIVEKPGLVHVLYRYEPKQPDMLVPIWPNIVSLEAVEGGWAMLPGSRLDGLRRLNLSKLLAVDGLDRVNVVVSDYLGSLRVDQYAYLVIRSRVRLAALTITKVSMVPMRETDPDFAIVRCGDRRATLELLNKRYGSAANRDGS